MWKSVVKINGFVMKFHIYLLKIEYISLT